MIRKRVKEKGWTAGLSFWGEQDRLLLSGF
jgi:hypothetical protein